MAPASAPTLRSLIAAVPDRCYANPTWKGLLYFARDLGIYAAFITALLCTDRLWLLVLLWPLTGLAISGLFVLGHDAAHGALFRSARLDRLIGHLALLPSLHAYSVWVLGHNRIHHVHTGCEDIDFVWHPLTRPQFEALSRWQQLRHRFEWSLWGAGVYYIRVVWWQRMMRLCPPDRFRQDFRRDRLLVWLYLAVASSVVVAGGAARYGSLGGGWWMWVKVLGIPWVCWNYFIAATVYVHHIAPSTVWLRRDRWTRFKGQVGATTNFIVPRWYNVFAHNIYLHVPHHVDPSIPFYHLPAAADALAHRYGMAFQTHRLRFSDYVAATRHCKLYDFERGVWSGYAGGSVPASLSGTAPA